MVRNDVVWKEGRTNSIYSKVGWRGRFLQSHSPPIKKCCKFPNNVLDLLALQFFSPMFIQCYAEVVWFSPKRRKEKKGRIAE